MPSDDKDTDALREHLQRYSEVGERHLFQLRDGRPFEGWVVEVGEEELLVTSPSPTQVGGSSASAVSHNGRWTKPLRGSIASPDG